MARSNPMHHTRKPVFHSLSSCASCGVSGDDFESANVEAFELTGDLYCDDCADEVIADNGQFGLGA